MDDFKQGKATIILIVKEMIERFRQSSLNQIIDELVEKRWMYFYCHSGEYGIGITNVHKTDPVFGGTLMYQTSSSSIELNLYDLYQIAISPVPYMNEKKKQQVIVGRMVEFLRSLE
jgi:hypothetical protein